MQKTDAIFFFVDRSDFTCFRAEQSVQSSLLSNITVIHPSCTYRYKTGFYFYSWFKWCWQISFSVCFCWFNIECITNFKNRFMFVGDSTLNLNWIFTNNIMYFLSDSWCFCSFFSTTMFFSTLGRSRLNFKNHWWPVENEEAGSFRTIPILSLLDTQFCPLLRILWHFEFKRLKKQMN